jgi:hypothetical protein
VADSILPRPMLALFGIWAGTFKRVSPVCFELSE